jgi:putative addiction module antidote
MVKTKIAAIGNSMGVLLPKEMLVRLNLEKGDPVFLVETERGVELTPYDPSFERQLKIASSLFKKHRSALKELAK